MNERTLLEALLQEGLTPNFSFPLDTCTFTAEGLDGWRAKTFATMTQDLRKGLREYAPGKIISVDGREYRVGGITWFDHSRDGVDRAKPYLGDDGSKAENLRWYSRCARPQCGWVHGDTTRPYEGTSCPNCGADGSDPEDRHNQPPVVSQWLRPEGFAPIVIPWKKADKEDKAESPNPTQREGRARFMEPEDVTKATSERSMGGRVELPAPLLNSGSGESELVITPNHGIFDDHIEFLTTRMEGSEDEGIRLILMNTGLEGRGMWLCPSCGRVEVKREAGFNIGGHGHHRPYVPTKGETDPGRCMETNVFGNQRGSNKERLMLGMEFRTDVSIIRFVLQENKFIEHTDLARDRELDAGIRALKEALLTEINAVFELEEREISAGYRKWKREQQSGSGLENELVVDLFLYDEVAGGAGLCTTIFTSQNADKLKKVIENTRLRLSGDACSNGTGCDRVCIGCLLDYRNREDHDYMDRRHGLRLLRWMLNKNDVPCVENGGAGPNEQPMLDYLATLLQTRDEAKAVVDEGIIKIRDSTGQTTFRLRPVSSYLISSEDHAIKSLGGEYEAMRLDLREKWDPEYDVEEDGKKIVHTVSMDVLLRETVALENRMFGPRPSPGIESMLD